MSKLKSAKGYFEKAREIQDSGTALMLEYRQNYSQASGEIELDRRLSPEGKHEAKADLKKRLGTEFLQKSHTRKQEYVSNLKKAIRDADKVVFAAHKKPDDTKLQRFETNLRALKTELMLSVKADRAYEKLTTFIAGIDDPYLAGMVRDQFVDISQSILSAPEANAQMRLYLSRTFQNLSSNFESEEVREAREILDAAKAAEAAPQLYTSGIVHTSAVDTFGAEYGRQIEKTDEFFAREENASLKPAEYVDAELKKDDEWAATQRWLREPIDNPTLKV